jgi:hypothetical protein
MRDTEEYEGFYIEPRSKQLDTGEWKSVARVFRLIDGIVDEFFPLRESEQTFTSEEEADDYALQEGKNWADRS